MEEKDDDLIKNFIRHGFKGGGGVDAVYAQSATLYAIKQLQDEMDRYSTPSSHSFDDTLNETILTDEYIDSLVDKFYSSGNLSTTTNPTPKTKLKTFYTLTQDMGYFVYWLMMNYSYIEENGYETQNWRITNNIFTTWGKTIINEGKYNETDRDFLNHVKNWLTENNWVYKKPELNEHNDFYERIQSLSNSARPSKQLI
jgi:hypothetical protein